MNPEVEALIAVYQRRLNDATSQAIAYEARVAMLTKQLEEVLAAQQAPPPPPTTPKRTSKKKVGSQDGGGF
tara:strand:- start:313 stop:525 length:213 start_codon:yes stop_codon:yes gene_type:complete